MLLKVAGKLDERLGPEFGPLAIKKPRDEIAEMASDVGDHEVGKWLCHSDNCDVIALMLVAAEVSFEPDT
jgi:hypothetical protein